MVESGPHHDEHVPYLVVPKHIGGMGPCAPTMIAPTV